MQCLTTKTQCRLCGAQFQEPLCLEENGVTWRVEGPPSPENGSPWCSVCLERINRTCAVLCADLDIALSGAPGVEEY